MPRTGFVGSALAASLLALAAWALGGEAAAAQEADEADLILTGGRIWTGAEAQPWAEALTIAADVAPGDRPTFERAVDEVREALALDVQEESPGDVIPLPDGHIARRRPALPRRPGGRVQHLQVYHFDPYSTAFRYLARGDEADYRLVLAFLKHGWITVPEMEARLEGLLPRFTSETIQQDPAEFRRKYKGLLQMWRSLRGASSNGLYPL